MRDHKQNNHTGEVGSRPTLVLHNDVSGHSKFLVMIFNQTSFKSIWQLLARTAFMILAMSQDGSERPMLNLILSDHVSETKLSDHVLQCNLLILRELGFSSPFSRSTTDRRHL